MSICVLIVTPVLFPFKRSKYYFVFFFSSSSFLRAAVKLYEPHVTSKFREKSLVVKDTSSSRFSDHPMDCTSTVATIPRSCAFAAHCHLRGWGAESKQQSSHPSWCDNNWELNFNAKWGDQRNNGLQCNVGRQQLQTVAASHVWSINLYTLLAT